MCKINKFIMLNLTFCASTKRDQLYLTHFFAFNVSNFPVQVSINQLEKENKYLSMITVSVAIEYRKIPKGSPGAYIFQRPFLRGLLLSFITDLWGDICVSKSIGLVLWLEGNLPFLLCFTLYLRAISNYMPLGALYLEGRIHGGAYFRNFTVH